MKVGEIWIILAQFLGERAPGRIAGQVEAICNPAERRKGERQARDMCCNGCNVSIEVIRRILPCAVAEVRCPYHACCERQYSVRRCRLVTTAAPQIHGHLAPQRRRQPKQASCPFTQACRCADHHLPPARRISSVGAATSLSSAWHWSGESPSRAL